MRPAAFSRPECAPSPSPSTPDLASLLPQLPPGGSAFSPALPAPRFAVPAPLHVPTPPAERPFPDLPQSSFSFQPRLSADQPPRPSTDQPPRLAPQREDEEEEGEQGEGGAARASGDRGRDSPEPETPLLREKGSETGGGSASMPGTAGRLEEPDEAHTWVSLFRAVWGGGGGGG
jgi:hypothetical protein